MSKFLTRERFGQPQFLAALLLLVFLAQCLWLASHAQRYRTDNSEEIERVEHGLDLWRNSSIRVVRPGTSNPSEITESFHPSSTLAFLDIAQADTDHSALWYLIPAAPFLFCPESSVHQCIQSHLWLALLPNLAFALLLGASLWYVARRLYGNAGGYIALAFYCFSPTIVMASASWFSPPEMGAAWGSFGAIFTAIAVSHTLYAPREVVLWNWRRILLLGLSFTLAVGSQFSLIWLAPVALLFMFYLAPQRKRAAFTIWCAACAVALVLLFAAYRFQPSAFGRAFHHANFAGFIWTAFSAPTAYWLLLRRIVDLGPAVLAALPVALIAYATWKRARYFGNTAPLLLSLFLLLLALVSPHYPGYGFALMAVPFLFVFIAGVIADLLETRHRQAVLIGAIASVLAGAAWNLWQLAVYAAG